MGGGQALRRLVPYWLRFPCGVLWKEKRGAGQGAFCARYQSSFLLPAPPTHPTPYRLRIREMLGFPFEKDKRGVEMTVFCFRAKEKILPGEKEVRS